MKIVQNILIPSDFSANANKALCYALKLYGDSNVNFHLFHAFTSPVQTGTLISVADIIKNESTRHLKRDFESCTKEIGVTPSNVQYIVENDLFYRSLKKVVADYKIDLVFMGTKGATNAFEELMGSNTSKIIKQATAPIIAVPNGYKTYKPTKILLAEDYKHGINLDVLEPLKELALKFNSSIDILYVKNNTESVNHAEARTKFDNFFGDIKHKYHCVEQADVAGTIESYMHEKQVKMVVTLPGRNNLFDDVLHKSVTNKIVLNTDIPLMALHQF